MRRATLAPDGQHQKFAHTSQMLDALVSPWSCLSAVVGLALAVVDSASTTVGRKIRLPLPWPRDLAG